MSSGTTIKQIGSYLDRIGWKNYEVALDTTDEGKIITGWKGDEGSYMMGIELDHRTQTALFVVPGLGMAPRDEIAPGRLADILMAIGFANYALLIGRFAYDPSDGEIRYNYVMPIDDAEMTYGQFKHLLTATAQVVNYWAPRLKAACGGARTGESIVDSFLGHIADFKP